MPGLAELKSASRQKILLIGDSGAGKTGGIADLAKHGYNLRWLDFDDGLESAYFRLKDDQAAINRVVFETLTDQLKSDDGKVVPAKTPTAFPRALELLDKGNFKDTEGRKMDLGPPSQWTENEVLVVDSLTKMAEAGLRYAKAMNNASGKKTEIQHYGDVVERLQQFLDMVHAGVLGCHVIVTSHIAYIGGDDNGVQKGYPSAIGQKLPPKIGRSFNTVLLVQSTGSGQSVKRSIFTQPKGLVEVKNPLGAEMPERFDLSDGLPQIMARLRDQAQ